jgi:CelD/BcsL family acetyltransferase involved in cellulose biosynthesis
VAWSVWARPTDLERELDEALALEASGWKGAEGGAILKSAELTEFYRELARAFDAERRFALATLRVDRRLAAVAICLVDFDRMWLLKTAYDEALGVYSPGTLLAFAIVERCFQLGLDACELLGDIAEWKRRLRPRTREYDSFRLYRRRPGPLAAFAYRRFLRPSLRRVYRDVRRRRTRPRQRPRANDSSPTSVLAQMARSSASVR